MNRCGELLRRQYLSDVRLKPHTYPDRPIGRVQAIYQTSRRGRIGKLQAQEIWYAVLLPLYLRTVADTLPDSQKAYDRLVPQSALAVASILKERGGFGVGQKMVNLFCKDLWALGLIGPATEQLLHAPLDRIVLGKIKQPPVTWEAWSRVEADSAADQGVRDYLAIQAKLRQYARKSPVPFGSLIQMEQFIWHRI
jgi:hypothetical protein